MYNIHLKSGKILKGGEETEKCKEDTPTLYV